MTNFPAVAEAHAQNCTGDLMIGAKSIADWMQVPVRNVFYMAERKHIPLFKIGGRLAGRKSTITAYYAQLEAEGRNAAESYGTGLHKSHSTA